MKNVNSQTEAERSNGVKSTFPVRALWDGLNVVELLANVTMQLYI